MALPSSNTRLNNLCTFAAGVAAIVLLKVLVEILYEYRWYFPADFDASAFLIGRRDTFFGVYRAAFYAHILGGPTVVILGLFLMFSGGRSRFARLHRRIGRILMLIVLAIVVPSGLAMAFQATAGPIAGFGFASLSIATAASAAAALHFARKARFRSHQKWATRCFILLCSPLLLRLISGAAIVMQLESDWFYRLNAWLSWLVPLAVCEAWWCRTAISGLRSPPLGHTREEVVS